MKQAGRKRPARPVLDLRQIGSPLEWAFAVQWTEDAQKRPHPPEFSPVREFLFHPERKWRFDFAWPWAKVAVELEGLTRDGRGRHQNFKGMAADLDKYNAALEAGWFVFRFSQPHLNDRPAETIDRVRRFLEEKARAQV